MELIAARLWKSFKPIQAGFRKVTMKSGDWLYRPSEKWKKDLAIGGIYVGKDAVSYHLMPMYMYPDLLNHVSPALKKRLKGKACFSFDREDEELFREIDKLTKVCYERMRSEGDLTS